MNTVYPNLTSAQNAADRIHNAKKAADAAYAASCQAYIDSGGAWGTARWAIPYQELDQNGNPIDSNWHVTVDNRVRGQVTSAEKRANIPEWKDDQYV